MDVELIINTADQGALQELRRQVALLREQGHLVHPRITFEAGDATRFAAEAALRGAGLVIAAGGDGTVNEVVNGLLGAGPMRSADELPRLGIVPLGTGNDFAGFMNIPIEIPEAVRTAVGDVEVRIDVAELNGRYFLNVSSGGLGAEATEEASERAKRLLGTVAYLVTGVRKFASLRPSAGRFLANGDVLYDGDFLFFAVGNGARTGGGNWVTPRANLSDGLLDLCIVEDLNHAEFVRLLPDLRNGEHVQNPHVTYRQIPELTIEPLGDLSVNVDGEPVPAGTLRYRTVPGALRVPVRGGGAAA